MGEIANAVGVPADDLLSFRPSSDGVRWKLHMASKRDTFVPEDAGCCLFGVCNVVMSVIPGETQHQAVARLLQEATTCSKSGDVGCLAWVGEPSDLNSCLPTHVKAYKGSCRMPTSIEEEGIRRSVLGLESSFTREDQEQALALYNELAGQPRAEFAGWHLRLPCIAFRITAFDADRGSHTNVYSARADALEPTKISTADRFSPRGLLPVCLWIHGLLDLGTPHGHRDAGGNLESRSGHLSEAQAESAVHENLDGPIRPWSPGNNHSQLDLLNVHYEHSRASTPTSFLPPSPSTPFGERTRVLRFVARLRQPMTALLLSSQRHGVYKRVATDHDIPIQLRSGVSLDSVDRNVEVVEIIRVGLIYSPTSPTHIT